MRATAHRAWRVLRAERPLHRVALDLAGALTLAGVLSVCGCLFLLLEPLP
ncbi:hypothetical protein [Sphingomonas elodea]|nr:hypothetical protein [Sphingomonas elodea]